MKEEKLILEYNYRMSEEEDYMFKNNNLQDDMYNKDIELGEVEK